MVLTAKIVLSRWLTSIKGDTLDHSLAATPQLGEVDPHPSSTMSVMCVTAADLEVIDRLSPTPSTASMEKYLATSPEEEGLTTTIIQTTVKDATFSKPSLPSEWILLPQSASVAGSDESVGSANSFASCNSRRSIDPRGPRRGRKGWASPSPLLEKSPLFIYPSSSEDEGFEDYLKRTSPEEAKALNSMRVETTEIGKGHPPAKDKPFFCTWPDCTQIFQYRYAWTRHEEAKHYSPYKWICFSNIDEDGLTTQLRDTSCFLCEKTYVSINHFTRHEQFSSCVGKTRESRTFYREDHLMQHVNGTHCKLKPQKIATLRPLLSAWKKDNHPMPKEALTCGFCGVRSGSWQARASHVSTHFKSGNMTKADWRIDRTLLTRRPERRAERVAAFLAHSEKLACDQCNKAFTLHADLRRHEFAVHNSEQNQAPLCSIEYAKIDNVLRHMKDCLSASKRASLQRT
jgi:hypothetical protein